MRGSGASSCAPLLTVGWLEYSQFLGATRSTFRRTYYSNEVVISYDHKNVRGARVLLAFSTYPFMAQTEKKE